MCNQSDLIRCKIWWEIEWCTLEVATTSLKKVIINFLYILVFWDIDWKYKKKTKVFYIREWMRFQTVSYTRVSRQCFYGKMTLVLLAKQSYWIMACILYFWQKQSYNKKILLHKYFWHTNQPILCKILREIEWCI